MLNSRPIWPPSPAETDVITALADRGYTVRRGRYPREIVPVGADMLINVEMTRARARATNPAAECSTMVMSEDCALLTCDDLAALLLGHRGLSWSA